MSWKRNCPKCNRILIYCNKYKLQSAINSNSHCRNCREFPKNTQFFRDCPKCFDIMFYTTERSLRIATTQKSLCKSCSKTGELSPVLGTKQSEEVKLKKNQKLKGKIRSLESKQRYSQSKRGAKNPKYNDHTPKSIEHRRKIRLGNIRSITQKLALVGKKITPKVNPIACQKIDQYGFKNGYKFQHGLNGEEFYIKELGYWVDGYDKDKNIVIEYYEKIHNRTKMMMRDAKRQKEIIDNLNCGFIIIRENGEISVSGNIH